MSLILFPRRAFGEPSPARKFIGSPIFVQIELSCSEITCARLPQIAWALLVPSSGSAATVQGEVIRISGRVQIEIEENGGVNWDGDYRKMVDAFLDHLGTGQPLPAPELHAARQIAAEVKDGRGDTAAMCRLAVDWIARNPKPIPLSPPSYRR